MIKVALKQGYNDIELEYNTIEAVEELIKVVGSGQEIENRWSYYINAKKFAETEGVRIC